MTLTARVSDPVDTPSNRVETFFTVTTPSGLVPGAFPDRDNAAQPLVGHDVWGEFKLHFIFFFLPSPHTLLCLKEKTMTWTACSFSKVVELHLPHSDGPVRTHPGQPPLLRDPKNGIDAARHGIGDRDFLRGLLDAPDVYVRVERT